MTKINVTFADESAKSVVVHTGLSYEIEPVSELKINSAL